MAAKSSNGTNGSTRKILCGAINIHKRVFGIVRSHPYGRAGGNHIAYLLYVIAVAGPGIIKFGKRAIVAAGFIYIALPHIYRAAGGRYIQAKPVGCFAVYIQQHVRLTVNQLLTVVTVIKTGIAIAAAQGYVVCGFVQTNQHTAIYPRVAAVQTVAHKKCFAAITHTSTRLVCEGSPLENVTNVLSEIWVRVAL